MKKSEQLLINQQCKDAYHNAMDIFYSSYPHNWKRIRTCSASVCDTEKYVYLRSYSTIIAFIDKETDTLYDVLRMVYGYTATSAQHMSKFNKDYGAGIWGCKNTLRYYNV